MLENIYKNLELELNKKSLIDINKLKIINMIRSKDMVKLETQIHFRSSKDDKEQFNRLYRGLLSTFLQKCIYLAINSKNFFELVMFNSDYSKEQ